MRRLWLVVLLGVCACSKKDAAIKLVITTVQARPDSCFEVTLSSASTDPAVSELARLDGKNSFTVTVQQGTNLPDDVEFKVQAWVSANGCAEPRWGNGVVTTSGHFTKGEITTVEAKLDALPDSDDDLTVDEVDCAPNDAARAQSLAERCGTRLDVDCDGVVACDDSDCGTHPCVAALAMLDGGVAVAGQCSSQTLTLLNAGAPEAPASAVAVVISSTGDGGINYFSDSNCGTPAVMLNVSTSSAPFSFKPTRAGPISISATANNYVPTQTAYVVNNAPANHCVIKPTTLSTDLGTCSETAEVRFFDEFENGAAFSAAFSVAPGGVSVQNANCSGSPDTSATPLTTFATNAAVPGTYVVSVDGGTFSCSLQGTASHPFPPGASQQWPLEIHVGNRAPDKGYVDYSVMALIDTSLANGDLHAYRWTGSWQEIPRYVTQHDSTQSEVWFRSQTAFADNSVNYEYALFVTDAGTAPNSPSVFLFTDDFEAGNLSRWIDRGNGGWSASGSVKRGGAFALHYNDTGTATGDDVIEANLANERDVYIEAWWNPDDATQINVAQMTRLQPGVVTATELNWDTDTWWYNAIGAGGSDRAAGRSNTPFTFPNDTFRLIAFATWGESMRAWSGGNPIQLSDGGVVVPVVDSLDAGHVGFRRWKTNKALSIDDVMVRRYTEPEPAVTVLGPLDP